MKSSSAELSRSEGQTELRRRPVGLATILGAVVSGARPHCAANHQTLTFTLPNEPIILEADAAALRQVFGHLLANACQHSGQGSHIAVTVECDAGASSPEVVVRIRDDGTGIDPRLLPSLFDFRPPENLTGDRGGRGLRVDAALLQLHGGILEAHSEGLGRGAEFTVRLPVVELFAAPSESAPPTPREIARRILIVDDNTDSTRSMASLQERRGHEVCTAAAGPEALVIAAEFRPEVVLLDIGLPGMDGLEVARQLRAMPGLNHPLLIAMTGYASAEDRQNAMEAGFDEHVVKPVDLRKLRAWLADDARFAPGT